MSGSMSNNFHNLAICDLLASNLISDSALLLHLNTSVKVFIKQVFKHTPICCWVTKLGNIYFFQHNIQVIFCTCFVVHKPPTDTYRFWGEGKSRTTFRRERYTWVPNSAESQLVVRFAANWFRSVVVNHSVDPNSAEQVFRVVCFVVNFELVVAVVINFLGYRIEPPAEF